MLEIKQIIEISEGAIVHVCIYERKIRKEMTA